MQKLTVAKSEPVNIPDGLGLSEARQKELSNFASKERRVNNSHLVSFDNISLKAKNFRELAWMMWCYGVDAGSNKSITATTVSLSKSAIFSASLGAGFFLISLVATLFSLFEGKWGYAILNAFVAALSYWQGNKG